MTHVVFILGLIVALSWYMDSMYDSRSVCPWSYRWCYSCTWRVCMTPVVSVLGLTVGVILVLVEYV